MNEREKLRDAIAQLFAPEVGEEMKHNIDALVKSYFEKMNLVTREQLDIQAKILARTRERLNELEKTVAELEAARRK